MDESQEQIEKIAKEFGLTPEEVKAGSESYEKECALKADYIVQAIEIREKAYVSEHMTSWNFALIGVVVGICDLICDSDEGFTVEQKMALMSDLHEVVRETVDMRFEKAKKLMWKKS